MPPQASVQLDFAFVGLDVLLQKLDGVVSELVPCIVIEGKRRTRQPPVRVCEWVSDRHVLPIGQYAVLPLRQSVRASMRAWKSTAI